MVAAQIQKLAEQSSESAKQIEAIILSLIEDSDKTVLTMNEVKDIYKVLPLRYVWKPPGLPAMPNG